MISLRSKLRFWHIVLGLIVVAGMGLRLAYLLHVSPWTDEYFTSLAILMTAQKGLPVLPSGLFYTHGLPYTYAAAALAWLFGFGQVVTRLPSFFVSLAALGLVYYVGQRWFSRRVGLIAVLLLSLSPEAIAWGGQARMYALWQFFTLAAVFGLYEGFCHGGSRAARVWGLVALSGAILCHLRTLLTLPPLVLGLAAAWWMGRNKEHGVWRPKGLPWMELAGLALVVVSPLILLLPERPGSLVSSGQVNITNWLNPLRLFADIVIGAMQFVIAPYLPLTVVALVGVLWLLIRLATRRPRPSDSVLLFLTVVGLGVLVEFSLTSSVVTRVPRYLFDILPLYFLVVAHELDFLAGEITARLKGVVSTAVGWAPMVIVVALFAGPALSAPRTQVSALEPALEYVRAQWQPGDRVATTLPGVAYLGLGHCDYFVALDAPFLWHTDRGPIDPHVGLSWIGTAEGLRQIARQSPRLWIVVEERYAAPYQEILGDQLVVPFREEDYVVYLVERQR